jgi:alkanesulfonate monooxygenase SsuD/methylene tetrahydromethanopterin reductase-like flavin-dependent oxidoreductase (luciferase family)
MGDAGMTTPDSEQKIVESIKAAVERRGWSAALQSFFGRSADVVVNLPGNELLLIDVKTPSGRIRFSDVAQLAEWRQLTDSVDQISRSYVALVTSGDVAESVNEYARRAGVWIIPIPSPEEDVGERVVASLEARRGS